MDVIQWRERLRRFGLEPSDSCIESEHARQVAFFFCRKNGMKTEALALLSEKDGVAISIPAAEEYEFRQ